MESNLIALHFLPAWLQFGANSKHYTYSILCAPSFHLRPRPSNQTCVRLRWPPTCFCRLLIQTTRRSLKSTLALPLLTSVVATPKHTSCMEFGSLSEHLQVMLVDPVVVWLPWLELIFPPLRSANRQILLAPSHSKGKSNLSGKSAPCLSTQGQPGERRHKRSCDPSGRLAGVLSEEFAPSHVNSSLLYLPVYLL